MQKKTWPTFGHHAQIAQLRQDIASGNVAQGYLFTGPDRIGKFTVAKAFAAELQGEKFHDHVWEENHMDTIFWKENGESLKVEHVREIIGELNLSFDAPYKIWIVQDASRLTIGAQNALLKTLEEPMERVVFIFTVEQPTQLLPTAVSRLRVVNFHNIPLETLREDLHKHLADRSLAEIDDAISFGMGKPGRALALLGDPRLLNEVRQEYQALEKLLSSPLYEQFIFLEGLLSKVQKSKNNTELDNFLENLLIVLRTKMHENPQDKTPAKQIQQLYRTREIIRQNINKRLALENFFLNL